ncbi:MAG: N-acetylmuramoyl-L-alanine amidase [Oscillospiraceae bacterium]|nr:N-acetylmuramoyl-L-alanine amidase [Oscillospiraceae bacterium]
MLTIIERYTKNNPAYLNNLNKADSRYVEFQCIGPKGAVLHSIGTPQPLARVIAEYFDSPEAARAQASVHGVLQADGTYYKLAPDNFRMWHAGGTANNTHMGIEMTEPDCIWYDASKGYKLHIRNTSKALDHVVKTYGCAVELFADLCIQHNWDPLEDGVILSHKECYERGIGSNHGDPEHLWDALNTGYTMDTFRAAVAKRVKELEAETLDKKIEVIVKQILNDNRKSQEKTELRYKTLADLKAAPNSQHYLPTVEKLIAKGYLNGKGGSGDDLILDFSEDSIRILVTLDRAGVYGE